jgi:hypothetical protein
VYMDKTQVQGVNSSASRMLVTVKVRYCEYGI